MKIENLRKELKKRGNKNKAQFLSRFFKTGKGEYAEGDIFIGVTVPESRVIANKYSDISIASAKKLLESKIHEERLVALLILISKYEKGNKKDKNVIYKIYLSNTKNINSWDLVDISAHKIVGIHLWHKETKVLTKHSHTFNFLFYKTKFIR
jgi:3-methyladenine DNA glycosylase AlkD